MTAYYDNQFNQNEWFIIILTLVAYAIAYLLPRRFPKLISAVFILYGIFLGQFIDHTLGLNPFEFYDVNDSSYFEFFDLLSYVMYGPFSYFIPYFFDKFRLKRQHIILYIVVWSLIALGLEWVGIQMEVYHYEKGWHIQYSFPSYLAINSILMALYYKLYKCKAV